VEVVQGDRAEWEIWWFTGPHSIRTKKVRCISLGTRGFV
jgi:hypothetical protein